MVSKSEYWERWGLDLFGGDINGVVRVVAGWLENGQRQKMVATVNPEFVMAALADADFWAILKGFDLRVVDGVGLLWAKKVEEKWREKGGTRWWWGIKMGLEVLAGKVGGNRVSGADLMESLSIAAGEKGRRVYFLGGWADRAEKTGKYLAGIVKKRLNKKLIYAFCPGEPEVSEEEVRQKIAEFRPDILLVALGMKKQEEWIWKNKGRVDFGVAMGVGRSFDYFSGELRRAPVWMRKVGLEWLFSLLMEPKRWRRQIKLVEFAGRVVKGK